MTVGGVLHVCRANDMGRRAFARAVCGGVDRSTGLVTIQRYCLCACCRSGPRLLTEDSAPDAAKSLRACTTKVFLLDGQFSTASTPQTTPFHRTGETSMTIGRCSP